MLAASFSSKASSESIGGPAARSRLSHERIQRLPGCSRGPGAKGRDSLPKGVSPGERGGQPHSFRLHLLRQVELLAKIGLRRRNPGILREDERLGDPVVRSRRDGPHSVPAAPRLRGAFPLSVSAAAPSAPRTEGPRRSGASPPRPTEPRPRRPSPESPGSSAGPAPRLCRRSRIAERALRAHRGFRGPRERARASSNCSRGSRREEDSPRSARPSGRGFPGTEPDSGGSPSAARTARPARRRPLRRVAAGESGHRAPRTIGRASRRRDPRGAPRGRAPSNWACSSEGAASCLHRRKRRRLPFRCPRTAARGAPGPRGRR